MAKSINPKEAYKLGLYKEDCQYLYDLLIDQQDLRALPLIRKLKVMLFKVDNGMIKPAYVTKERLDALDFDSDSRPMAIKTQLTEEEIAAELAAEAAALFKLGDSMIEGEAPDGQ